MREESFTNSKLFKLTIFLIAAFLIVTIFILGKPFLVPFAWSLLIALASVRMLDKIEHKLRLKRIAVTISFVLIVIILFISLFYFFYVEIRMIVSSMPDFAKKIATILQKLSTTMQSYGISIPDHIAPNAIHNYVSGHTNIITGILAGFGQGIGKIFLVGIYLFFLIYYRDNYLYYMKEREKTYEKFKAAKEKLNEILDIINNFLYGLVIVTLIIAVMLFVIFLLIGLKFALFFAVFVALLTLIPILGIPIGMAIVFTFGLLAHDGLLTPVLAVVGILVSNFFQENVFKPLVIGEKIKLNAFMIFLSVIIGGLIWGVPGMILFMPMVGIIKLLLERNENTKPIAILFTQVPDSLRHHFHQSIKNDIKTKSENAKKKQ